MKFSNDLKIYAAVFIVWMNLVCPGKTLGLASAVTYTFSGGRLGDNLVAYCHAKWISYKYKIPLLYKPFGYSDELMMHVLEIPYSQELEQQFQKVIIYPRGGCEIDPHGGILYVIPFFCESIFNINDPCFPFLFIVDWKDPEFKAELKKMISPREALEVFDIPHTDMTIALHIRKGTGWDIPVYRITPAQLTASHPLRFAPDSFYIHQLKKITQLYKDASFYVHLFTDHNDPAQLAADYQAALNCNRVTFGWRTALNNEFVNVLEDFFALTHFDCLIRPDSNFSIVASKLADYKILISPWHGVVHGDTTLIDEINFEIGGDSFIMKEGV